MQLTMFFATSFSTALVVTSCLGCSIRSLPSEERVEIEAEEKHPELGFAMAEIFSGLSRFEGMLEWTGGGSDYRVFPAVGTAHVEHQVFESGSQVFAVDPCPEGQGQTFGNVQPDCRVRLETQVEVEVATTDEGLHERWPAILEAYAVDSWNVVGESRDLAGEFRIDSGPDGPLTFYVSIDTADGMAQGSFGASTESLRQPLANDSGSASGTATGFQAATWTSRATTTR